VFGSLRYAGLRRPPKRLRHADVVRDGFDVDKFETYIAPAGGVVSSAREGIVTKISSFVSDQQTAQNTESEKRTIPERGAP
jgi:hypothetical protein